MLQMKLKQLQAKQKGFTLLELLVVITLLAVLSVGALVAYEGIGDNAQATAAANNTAGADRAIRNYRAVTLNYPDQWDNLSAPATAAPYSTTQVVDATQQTFGSFNFAGADASFKSAVLGAFQAVGVGTIQQVTSVAVGVEPNVQHNEGANPTGANEVAFADVTQISIVPSVGSTGLPGAAGTACTAGGQPISAAWAIGNNIANDNAYGLKLNRINDSLEDDDCHLVIALGFGHDAAHSTSGSSVAISTAPTYVSKTVNPAKSYARYVALFHVGTADAGDDIEDESVFTKPRLIAVVDTEGNAIDANIAKQNP